MTWQAIYQHLDDDVLSTWANPGLLRRAKKALEANEVTLLEIGAEKGQWQNDDAIVTLNAQGLTQAACNCPAAGACKHILAAVLHLQQHMANAADTAVCATASATEAEADTAAAATAVAIATPTPSQATSALPAWLAPYQHLDEVALSTWGNPGLLRRANKAVEAGEVTLLEIGAEQGQWQNDDALVTLNAQGLTQAACNCPAAGACKHILAAVLWVQQTLQDSSAAADTSAEHTEASQTPNSAPTGLQAALSEALNWKRLNVGKIGKVHWRQAYAVWADWQQGLPPSAEVQNAKILFHTDLSSDAVVYLLGGGFAGM